jgi:16S rRNA (cytosine967-C5)-methyltransferase
VSRFHSYLNSAAKILSLYKGNEPFALFLKKYFAQNKKFGAKDRKQINQLCYGYFRTTPRSPENDNMILSGIEEEILRGLFLCSTEKNDILDQLRPGWNEIVNLSPKEKEAVLNPRYSFSQIFPWKDELSNGIDYEKFCESFLIQPDLFLRIRPGFAQAVTKKLEDAGIRFEIISDSCFALANTTKIVSVIGLDKEAVVQDYSSQQTGRIIQLATGNGRPASFRVWDCCAGSGGKSIMLYDLNPGIHLTVSDKRESILINLRNRFDKAGIKNYQSFIADLSRHSEMARKNFDLIIADVPCTGSGTWSRTPEQLYFFEPGAINEYAVVQKKIVLSVAGSLKPGGYFVYITCSVFKKENEEAADFIKLNTGMQLVRMELLKGFEMKADSMFIAIFRKAL